jgi:hypothetical protein
MFCPKKFKLSQKVKTLKFPTRNLKKLQTVTGHAKETELLSG